MNEFSHSVDEITLTVKFNKYGVNGKYGRATNSWTFRYILGEMNEFSHSVDEITLTVKFNKYGMTLW